MTLLILMQQSAFTQYMTYMYKWTKLKETLKLSCCPFSVVPRTFCQAIWCSLYTLRHNLSPRFKTAIITLHVTNKSFNKNKKKNGFCWQMLSGSIPSRVQRTRTKSTNTWKEFSFSQVSPEKENVLLRVSLPGNICGAYIPTNATGVLNGCKKSVLHDALYTYYQE